MTVEEETEERVEDGDAGYPDSPDRTQRDPERNDKKADSSRRSAFRALVQDFNPIWYVYTLPTYSRGSAGRGTMHLL